MLVLKGCMLYDSTCTMQFFCVSLFDNIFEATKGKTDQWLPGIRDEGEEEVGELGYKKAAQRTRVVMKMFFIFTEVMVTQIYICDKTAHN